MQTVIMQIMYYRVNKAIIEHAVYITYWFLVRRKTQSVGSDASATKQRDGIGEDAYEEPDKTATATGPTAVRKFELTDCPAYATTDHTLPGMSSSTS